MPNKILTSTISKILPMFGCNNRVQVRYPARTDYYGSVQVCLPVCLVGGDKAGNIAQDSTATLNDGEGVRVTAVGERSHQKGQSSVHGADVCFVLRAVSRQVPQRAQHRLQSRLLKRRTEEAEVRAHAAQICETNRGKRDASLTFCTSRAQPVRARTLPTSRSVFLLLTSARHERFLNTLAMTCNGIQLRFSVPTRGNEAMVTVFWSSQHLCVANTENLNRLVYLLQVFTVRLQLGHHGPHAALHGAQRGLMKHNAVSGLLHGKDTFIQTLLIQPCWRRLQM